jgi:hypothetical protein
LSIERRSFVSQVGDWRADQPSEASRQSTIASIGQVRLAAAALSRFRPV